MHSLFSHGADIAGAGSGDMHAAIMVVQILLIIAVGRALGEIMARLGQLTIMGYLMAGLLLGPSFFGHFWPDAQKAIFPTDAAQKAMLDALSQFGILLLLLFTGMETDTRLVRRAGPASLIVALCGLAVPFILGAALGHLLPSSLLPKEGGKLVPSLFLGTALAISSVKIVASVVREMNFMRRDLGQIIVASAIAEDTICWIIISILLGLTVESKPNFWSAAQTLGEIGIFLALSFTIGRRIVFWLIQWTNDNFEGDFPVITAVLAVLCVMSIITQVIGVHTVLGAFVAGVLVGQSPLFTDHIRQQFSGLIATLFLPIFFGSVGLGADLWILKSPSLLGWTAVLVAIASLGKFAGAFIGGRLSSLKFRQSLALGCAMNARGSTEVIVVSVGLSAGMLTRDLFTMAVTMALITTTAMPPLLRATLSRLPMEKQEKQRIEREDLDARGFVPNLDRLLLAVDGSKIGQLAARIGGLIAGVKGMPVTLMHFEQGNNRTRLAHSAEHTRYAVHEGARSSATAHAEDDAPPGEPKVNLNMQMHEEPTDPRIDEEKAKGYDLLVIGVMGSHDKAGAFTEAAVQHSAGFEGPMVILTNPDEGSLPDLDESTHILVPINGTEISRRAAEVALAIARPTKSRVSALYVATGDAGTVKKGYSRARRRADPVLKDTMELAERYDVKAKTIVEMRSTPAAAILKEANKKYGIIVLGVGRRPGETLFFGDTAATILAKWQGAILFVVS